MYWTCLLKNVMEEEEVKTQIKVEKKLIKGKDLMIERRAVFRGWLKNIFLGQAVLSLGLSWVMATNPKALFGGFDWFYNVRSM